MVSCRAWLVRGQYRLVTTRAFLLLYCQFRFQFEIVKIIQTMAGERSDRGKNKIYFDCFELRNVTKRIQIDRENRLGIWKQFALQIYLYYVKHVCGLLITGKTAVAIIRARSIAAKWALRIARSLRVSYTIREQLT